MTTTFITANTIGAGTQFTFTAAGDALVVLPNVTLGSTNGTVISLGGFSDVEISVLGTLVSTSAIIMALNSSFTLAVGASYMSFQPFSSNTAVFANLGNNFVQIDGTLSAPEAIAILADGGDNTFNVTGSVTGASGVFLGLSGNSGDILVNSGSIMANTYDDVVRDTRYNNAVLTEGANTRITNHAGGTITAVSSEGAAVRVSSGGNGTVVTNAGTLNAQTWFGVDFSAMSVSESATLVNTGIIAGGTGAFNGNDSADRVTNRGTMTGDVVLNEGNDTLDGRGGWLDGLIFGGDGDDRLDFRGAGVLFDTVYGGTGQDTIRGTDGDDTLLGEVGADLLTGGRGDDVLDGGNDRDTLSGGAGDDTITGGPSGDVLTGGAGSDRFQFNNLVHIGIDATNQDIVTDFTNGQDLIDLTKIDANTLVALDQAFTYIGSAAFTGVAGQMRYSSANGLLQGDIDADAIADFSMLLSSLPALTVAAFVL